MTVICTANTERKMNEFQTNLHIFSKNHIFNEHNRIISKSYGWTNIFIWVFIKLFTLQRKMLTNEINFSTLQRWRTDTFSCAHSCTSGQFHENYTCFNNISCECVCVCWGAFNKAITYRQIAGTNAILKCSNRLLASASSTKTYEQLFTEIASIFVGIWLEILANDKYVYRCASFCYAEANSISIIYVTTK